MGDLKRRFLRDLSHATSLSPSEQSQTLATAADLLSEKAPNSKGSQIAIQLLSFLQQQQQRLRHNSTDSDAVLPASDAVAAEMLAMAVSPTYVFEHLVSPLLDDVLSQSLAGRLGDAASTSLGSRAPALRSASSAVAMTALDLADQWLPAGEAASAPTQALRAFLQRMQRGDEEHEA
jgi:predicted unusual protein kinase regulating ubiquinone biosynthesis (AarF/ABC1/UbiB family)